MYRRLPCLLHVCRCYVSCSSSDPCTYLTTRLVQGHAIPFCISNMVFVVHTLYQRHPGRCGPCPRWKWPIITQHNGWWSSPLAKALGRAMHNAGLGDIDLVKEALPYHALFF